MYLCFYDSFTLRYTNTNQKHENVQLKDYVQKQFMELE